MEDTKKENRQKVGDVQQPKFRHSLLYKLLNIFQKSRRGLKYSLKL